MDQMVRHDGNVVRGVLVRPVKVHVAHVAASDRGRALQEVILTLAALDAARRRRAVVVREVRQLAHEAAPVDGPLLHTGALLAWELRGPKEVYGLVRDVVAGRAKGMTKLCLGDMVAALRIQLAECLAKDLPVGDELISQRLGDMSHVALLRLVGAAADVDARAIDEVSELLKGGGALVVLVHGPDEHVALVLVHLDAHLVKDVPQVLREDEARLCERAVLEDVDEPRPPCVALLHHLAQALHPVHGVRVRRRRVVEVRQVRRPHLEVVAGLLVRRVDGAAARVVLVLVAVERVAARTRL
mmetsp:Transcript_45317/g.117312  ORF Transcript_45317/g.117312 Transcript_45317/m.117312 type:complete len:300 (-) Transcript_45317:585-1484(-)